MKIALNVDAIRQPLTGIGRYNYELAKGLATSSQLSSVQFLRYGSSISLPWDELLAPPPVDSLRRSLPRYAWVLDVARALRNYKLQQTLKQHQDVIYHMPNFLLPKFDGISVSTFHDLTFLHYPHFHKKELVKMFERELPKTLARATHFITDSEFVREEMIRSLGVAPTKVTTVPIGVGPEFAPKSELEIATVLKHYNLSYQGYILTVATLEPRKNLLGLLDAFMQLPKALQARYKLVLIGAKGWHAAPLKHKIETLQQQGVLAYLGYVPESDLSSIYAGAKAFVYPSFYEGFGLPPLEAMASGVPVLTSENSAMAEVVGNAGILTDPHNIEALSGALMRLLDDEALCLQLKTAGLIRAKAYTWSSCVKNTIQVYRSLTQ